MPPRRNPRRFLQVLSVLAALAACAAARPRAVHAVSEQVPAGPRALGMGGAFSAVSDDASAMFWNPAGLAQIEEWQVTGSTSRLYDTDLRESRLNFALPIARRHAFGAYWDHSGFEDSELAFSEDQFGLTYSLRAVPLLELGATGRFLTRSTGLDGTVLRRGTGFGFDLGALLRPMRSLRLGLVGQDLFDTELRYDQGGSALVYPRNVRVGAAYTYRRLGTAAFDLDDRWHAGVEVTPDPRLALRAGAERDLEDPQEGPTWSAGVGVRLGLLGFDFAYVAPPSLPSTSHFGLSLAFTPSPSLLTFERVEPEPLEIFPAFAETYAQRDSGIGYAYVSTKGTEAIHGTMSVFIPELMAAPSEKEVTIAPGYVNRIPLEARLTPAQLQEARPRTVRLEVAIAYTSSNLSRADRMPKTSATAYGAGYIDWDRGLDVAAAMVTPLDPPIDSLASEVGRWAGDQPRRLLGSGKLTLAAGVVDALGALGIRYVPDPDNPYGRVGERRRAIDRISYPRQTLASRRGDCDDMTVLLASALANVGVGTKFVDAPGHIFLLADTDLPARDAARTGVSPDLFVPLDDRLWVPIEATRLDSGFAAAWEIGAREVRQLPDPADPAVFVDVSEAMARYPAGAPLGAVPAVRLDPARLAARAARSVATVEGWGEATRRAMLAQLDATPAPGGWNTAASVEYRAGSWALARRSLVSGLAAASSRVDSLALRTNLASVQARSGDLAGADAALRAVLADGGADVAASWLNLGLVHAAAGDTMGAVRLAAEPVRRAGGTGALAQLLALEPAEARTAAGIDGVTEAALRRLLQQAGRSAAGRPAGKGSAAPPALPPGTTAPSTALAQGLLRRLVWRDLP